MKKKEENQTVPFLVTSLDEPIFSIEDNGDIILRGKTIGNDKELGDILRENGKVLRKFNDLLEKSNA